MQEISVFEPFNQLSAEGQRLLLRHAVRKAFAARQTVIHKGQPTSGAYVVLSGSLRVFAVAPSGTEATLYTLRAGQTCVLALNCLFNDLLYPAWVQAEGPARVAIIPGTVYRNLFSKETAIQEVTVQALSTLVWRLMSELESVHSCTHRQRLAHHLLTHASSEGELLTTQQELAGHLGTTREVIGRLMQRMVADGFVSSARGRVTIKDLFGLRRLLAPGTF